MPRSAEGMLDDIGAAASPEPEATSEPVADEPREPSESRPISDDIGGEKPETKKTDPANSPARPDGYVPKQAIERVQGELQAERQARERAEANFQKFLDRWHQENAPAEQQQDGPDLGPDPDEDPIGALKWAREQRAKDIEARKQWETQRSQQTQAQQIISHKTEEYRAVKEQFPAIEDARQTVLKGWHRELWLQGYRGADLDQRVAHTEAQWVLYAHQRNMPIGEVIAGLAMARGWQPPADGEQPAKKDEPAEKDTPQRDPTTGKFVASEAEKAARIKESQERNGSLTQAPGTPVEKMTAKELAKMSEEDMWKHFDSMKGRKGSKAFDTSMGFR